MNESKKLTHSLPAKVTAVFLLVAILIGLACSAAVIAANISLGVYTGDYGSNRQEIREHALRTAAYALLADFRNGNDLRALYANASFCYTVTRNETGETVVADMTNTDFDFSVTVTGIYADAPRTPNDVTDTTVTATGMATTAIDPTETADGTEIVIRTGDVDYRIYPHTEADTLPVTTEETYTYTATLYAKHTIPDDANDRFALITSLLNLTYRLRYTAIVLCGIGIVLFFALLIFLYCSAGRRRGEAEPRENLLDRIPFDIFTALLGGMAIVLVYAIAGCIFHSHDATVLWICCAAIGCILLFLLYLLYTMSIATRIKCGRLLKNTLLWRILSLTQRGICDLFSLLAKLPTVWKTALLTAICFTAEWIALLAFQYDYDHLLITWLFTRAILFVLILYFAVSLRRLQKAGEQIAVGSLDSPVDTSGMIGNCKKFGQTLSNIENGLSLAVEDRMKSERLKTELITNVSHDIKTPLTSIINYVDLLKKEESENDTVRQYLDILERQSARLKKLIEDLMEASKASTGNISIELAPCEVGILLEQAVGEYAERLHASALTPILTLPETPVYIIADGRRLWRVFDNLMCNICKYAQSETRVYLELAVIGSRAVITFKNISRERLTALGEELTERFVRGDSSRSTEGSGLGLSIAQSLTELQGGRLMIATDGDLFKATVSFALHTPESADAK